VSGLTDFQAEVSRLFFSLPASNGFLLAGGGALLASGLTTRPTQDLDFFGHAPSTSAPREISSKPRLPNTAGSAPASKTVTRSLDSGYPA